MKQRLAYLLAHLSLMTIVALPTAAAAQAGELVSGQNINMVSGTQWPGGDPFLQRQNEGSIAVSSRNPFHLLAGSNDYRSVDLPGLSDGKTVGDSWVSVYRSGDGGGRWDSILLPGYLQDGSALGLASPLSMNGYEASADPVVRSGTHGLFFYSGIAFTRGDAPPSAGFVATFMDLNNNETGTSTGYVDTRLFDQNIDGLSFIDKPWIAVDKPRPGAQAVMLDVNTDSGVVQQTVECGNLYVAYARIQGDGTSAISSQIMFTRSEDCARTFSTPVELNLPDTINQGAAIAVQPLSGRVQVAWRQFANATMNCTVDGNYWFDNPGAWPIGQLDIAGETYENTNIDALWPGKKQKGGTPWLVLRELVGAWLNVLAGADNSDIAGTMADAEDWLVDWPPGSKPKKNDKKQGNNLRKALDDFNKGKTGPGFCDDMVGPGMLSGMNPDAIMVVHSDDFGDTWSDPVQVTDDGYNPFEQGTTEFSFRTTGFPSMVFDGDGRSYIAYATRGAAAAPADPDPVSGDSRIVVTTSMNGETWTTPQAIDEPEVPGHQLMPALESVRNQVFVLYDDFREDISGVFDRFIVDLPVDVTIPRHSADVRAAVADAADVPVFTDYTVLDLNPSTQASRYPFLILDNGGMPQSTQIQYNPPNLPMFKGGTVPFFGDYLDLAALHFVKDDTGAWDFDLDPDLGPPVVHAIWTDNRDVVGPPDGDWTSYVPPGDGTLQPSLFDPTRNRPVCAPGTDPTVVDRTKMRNQNVYTSRLTQGIAFGLPANNRPLGAIQRAFVGFLQNQTDTDKKFRLQILNQPDGGNGSDPAERASFDQFSLETTRDEVVERYSSIARTIYVTSTDVSASVDISVVEVDVTGAAVPGGLTAVATINPDPSAPAPDTGNILAEEVYDPAVFNPAVFNPAVFNAALLGTGDVGIYDPAIFNPAVFNNPTEAELLQTIAEHLAILNPAVFNPAVFNPAVFNPAVFNPAVFNPAVFNPAVFNPAVFNPAVFNPAVFNPAVFNPAVFNSTLVDGSSEENYVETSVVIENQGNATAAYSLNLDLENPPVGFIFQVLIYKTYLVPTVDGCDLTQSVVQEALVNELSPDVNGSLLDPDSISFVAGPGDNVVVSVRIIPDPMNPGDPADIDTLPELDLSQSVVPQAVDTPSLNNGETQPMPVSILAPSLPPLVVATTSLPDGTVSAAYAQTLTTSGGGGTPVTWELVPGSVLPLGLSLVANQITGTPTMTGTFNFSVRAIDDDQIAEQALTLTINPAGPGGLPALSLRGDFDVGPYAGGFACLRFQWVWNDTLDPGETVTTEVFEDNLFAAAFYNPSATPLNSPGNIGSVLTNNFGVPTNNVGYELIFDAPSLADGIGYMNIDFSEVVDTNSLQIRGQNGCVTPQTPFAPVTLCKIDQSNDFAPFQGFVIPGSSPVGQSFTPTDSSLNTVELQMNRQTSVNGVVYVRIRSGSISGPILGTSNSVTVTNEPPAAQVHRYRFSFASAVALTPGLTYVAEVVHSSGGPVGVFVNSFGSNTYAGGTAIFAGNPSAGDDLSFLTATCQ